MDLLLIVRIGGTRVALDASEIESVIELDALSPVPRAPKHLAGLSALRSRVLTVVDCKCALELGTTEFTPGEIHEAAVTEIDGHHYALSVDSVEDVIEAQGDLNPVRAAMGGGWERVAAGMVETGEGPLLLVDIAKLIEGPKKDERAAA
ncbi:chemotaxis protein CheW [Sphingomicrobium aestuariivivum]|uniref:chemotaxis protein CheW n=1 Tax=Sphingomicrobium aestuariivivum TaxID=1582356 RepID=UPI001FD6A6A8|nr:chemotaxis protein CheW [Sphingomicrobium aestuariivivum]MCJ8190002.1 chemotaxis protein CheW [Sphingomicrobium aestuariivivum]